MSVVRDDDAVGVVVDGSDDPLPISYAFGSGKTGITYLAVQGPETTIELHKSYFPSIKRWYTTPGHELEDPRHIGVRYSGPPSARCFSCHTSAMPQRGFELAADQLGVGCESCHGPAGRHVQFMRGGKHDDIGIERLSHASSERNLAVCGNCHRTGAMVTTAKQKSMTQRFQPYGLMLSKCFAGSRGTMSCSTCHDPHSNASRDSGNYVEVCLGCHGNRPVSPTLIRAAHCRVAPRSNCLPCHMPRRKVFADGAVPTRMPEHRIGIYRGSAGG